MLDFFRRGEVARDVRLLAAQGAIAPRPLEQLALLMLLSSDRDTEIREIAEATLQNLPKDLIADFIARADTPTELREFFVGRGIAPSNTPAPDYEEPAADTDRAAGVEWGTDPSGQQDGLLTQRRIQSASLL